jgi:hypothetical protein
MINKVATTHCSFLRLQIKRDDIIDKCRECDKDRNIHNFMGCLYRVKQINLHRLQISEMEILAQPLSLPFIIENLSFLTTAARLAEAARSFQVSVFKIPPVLTCNIPISVFSLAASSATRTRPALAPSPKQPERGDSAFL